METATKDLTKNNARKKPGNYEKIRNTWWFPPIVFFLGILVTAFVQNKIFPPKQPSPDLDITYSFVETSAKIPYFSGELHVDYNSDKNINGLQVIVKNHGDKNAKNLEINIRTKNKEIILEPAEITFDPTTLDRHIADTQDYNKGNDGIYRKLDVFQSNANINIVIYSNKKVTENDILIEISSEEKIWTPKKGAIEYKQNKRKSSYWGKSLNMSKAFAQDLPDKTPKEPYSNSKSGILIGGYDPLIMTNNLFMILQKEKLIDKYEAQKIKDIVEGEKKGVLFGGINILKFNEVVLNALIKNDKLSKKQALEIIDKSKNSGGILVGGYNVIVLEIEIMNALIKNGFIDLGTAQSAVDSAKSVTP